MRVLNPPCCAECLLRVLLNSRDRDTVTGDLLEEYREVAVPELGLGRARWWYRRQVAGFLWQATRLPALMGVTIGFNMGLLILVNTVRQPLADDEPLTMLAGAVVVAVWSAAAIAVTWRSQRIGDAVKAGAVLGIATLLVFHAAAIVRVNLFLDAIRYRDDWQNLIARYQESGLQSLRLYANYEYIRGIPMIIALGAIAGSVSGGIGGLLNKTRGLLSH